MIIRISLSIYLFSIDYYTFIINRNYIFAPTRAPGKRPCRYSAPQGYLTPKDTYPPKDTPPNRRTFQSKDTLGPVSK